ncbi:hypothetical protein CCP2SC5_500007 [Azospirillaceae bacterium]
MVLSSVTTLHVTISYDINDFIGNITLLMFVAAGQKVLSMIGQ